MIIKFVGDIMLGELLENHKRGVHTFIQRGLDPFEFCKDELKHSDICVGNLECAIADTSDKGAFFREILRAPRSSVKILAESGITLCNLANNHTLDHGREALRETIDNLKSHDIGTFGYSIDRTFQEQPVVIGKGEVTVGFLGYNLANYTSRHFNDEIERIYHTVQAAGRTVEFLVVSLHWGHEYVDVIDPALCQVAKQLFFCGCDLVYGHHSHRLQGVFCSNGQLLASSLGNFIFDDRRSENRLTGVLSVEIDNGGIRDFTIRPFYINRFFQPVPNDSLSRSIDELNSKLERVCSINNDGDAAGAHNHVERMARSGHFKNRVRMRLLMLIHWYNYWGHLRRLWKFRKRNSVRQFSVTDN
jgi:poly-gamma-glutamate synthesis protein (capsule biosynthesis protein)